jgi:bifunctional non-homologous end joining protein LigD
MASQALTDYNRRRDFKRTPEPAGKFSAVRKRNLTFLVQKHDARRLHYDLRLEWKGVLLSWAVTKGPSADPRQKRLAVRTEDHPLSYGEFEGVIPARQYGGGTVMLWDQGQWEPLTDPDTGLEQGKLRCRINGARMKGEWTLVRMHDGKNNKRENWLLIKSRDHEASDQADELVEKHSTSVKTQRDMQAIASEQAPSQQTKARTQTKTDTKSSVAKTRAPRALLGNPKFQAPQLATLVDSPPESDKWLYETKFDGYRCLVSLGKDGVRFFTRSGLDWTEKFKSLSIAFEQLPCRNALIDGEVMAAKRDAASAFSALQSALKHNYPLVFYAFDILVLDGKDLKSMPQIQRKEKLEKLLLYQTGQVLHYSAHLTGQGDKVLRRICRAGGEGIIGKRADAPYRSTRTKQWLKVKCTRRQEFVVGGYSPSAKRSRAFASILVGNFENGKLHYRGRVGSGFKYDELQRLQKIFTHLSRQTSPFTDIPANIQRGARWVNPKIVIEVDFTEFTADGYIRHGVYLGQREDKMAEAVELEKPKTSSKAKPSRGAKQHAKKSDIGGIGISSGDREIFPQANITKLDLAQYYQQAGERIAAIAASRPFSLVRCPKGISGECFFQKHASKGFPKELYSVDVKESSGKVRQYLYIKSAKGAIAAAQMGAIEFHMWGSKIDKLEKPDRLVFDLDPDQGLGFDEVKKAAIDIQKALDSLGLVATPLLTGGKGIHVCVPLRRTVSWETLKIFAKTFATIMAEAEPNRFTATMSKAKRKGRIFIDWLRNERGATAIVPYSVRARPGAPVATPITWKALDDVTAANQFTIPDMNKRLKAPCPYLKALEKPQSLNKGVLTTLEQWLQG